MNCPTCNDPNSPYNVRCKSCNSMMPTPGYDPLDDLCLKMLQLGAFAEGTHQMTGGEIKALLVPFFGEARVESVLTKFKPLPA